MRNQKIRLTALVAVLALVVASCGDGKGALGMTPEAAAEVGTTVATVASSLTTTTTTIPAEPTTTTLPPTTTTSTMTTTTEPEPTSCAEGAEPFPWNAGNSDTGVLLEGVFIEISPGQIHEFAYLSGVPGESYLEPGATRTLPICFGVHPTTGEDMIIPWSFGLDSTMVILPLVGSAPALYFDPDVDRNPAYYAEYAGEIFGFETVITNVSERISLLEGNKMYPMELLVGMSNPMPISCIEGRETDAEYCQEQAEITEMVMRMNVEAVQFIKGERNEPPTDLFYLVWPPVFFERPVGFP